MKKYLSLLLAVALVFTGLTYVPTKAFADASGTVVLSGSTSVNPLIQALGEAFMLKNPSIKIVEQNVTGSGSGIADANNLNSGVDFGMSSRNLTSTESTTLNKIQICMDGLAIVVNNNNPLGAIDPTTLYKIYTKDASFLNWNQITGSYSTSVKIAPFGREAGSGTRSCFEDFFKAEYGTALPSGYDVNLDGSLASTGVMQASVQNNSGSIGYMSLGDMDETKVKALKVEGVEPSKYAVADGTYPIKRPFLLVYNKQKTITPAAQAFLDYINSAEGQAIIDKLGFVKNGLMRIKASDLTLSATAINIAPGATATLKATVIPDDTLDKSITYTSADASIATVTASGVITAVKVGSTTISVKTNDGTNIVKTCTVNVANPVTSAPATTTGTGTAAPASTTTTTTKATSTTPSKDNTVSAATAVSGIKLNKTSTNLDLKKQLTLKATISPANATNKKLTWSSSKTSVATVSSKGVVKGLKVGTATITVKTVDGKKVATCKVKVIRPVKSVKLDQTSISLKIKDTVKLKATINPSNASSKKCKWTSSKPSVALVLQNGSVVGVKAGTAKITVKTTNGKKATCTVKVE